MTLHDAMQPVLCDGNGPLLDIRGNPAALPELVAVREVCRRIAISAPGDPLASEDGCVTTEEAPRMG